MNPMAVNSIPVRRSIGTCLLFILIFTRSYTQEYGNAFPLNTLEPEALASIKINGVLFHQLAKSEGDEGEIAALCDCRYTMLKSEDPGLPWIAYTLFEGEHRFALSFGAQDNGRLGITHLDLIGARATVTLKGVTLSRGDTVKKLGALKSRKQYNGGALHFALFAADAGDTFFHIDFEPMSGEIQKIGYIVPF
jgi:hypothetical protein